MFSKVLATTALASLADAQSASATFNYYSVTPPAFIKDNKDLVTP